MNQKKYGISTVKPTRFVFIENHLLRVLFYCILFLAIAMICFVIGVMIGYAVLGKGNPLDVLNWKTWQHILDFLK